MSRLVRLILFVSLVPILLFPAYQPSGLYNEIITDKKEVALTFDDGPLPDVTEAILDILDQYKVKATFFIIGTNILKYPYLVEKIYFAGHEVGNHTYHHLRLDTFPEYKLKYELEETNQLMENIIGITPKYFRPPGGRFNNIILSLVNERNLIPVGWSINTSDFLYGKKTLTGPELDQKVEAILNLIHLRLKPGAIILMHNGNDVSIKALPQVLSYIKEQGYTIKKLSDVKLKY
ncbi:MAG: hypothetical protein A2Y40_09845 [Candidatus Margulisbacteria bacterium GWF2_35_9]|nr:MAG: hypothetical protein A2Y40_09845 [Candidatus Margulisbacteria bacterium GWF2_35_9]